MWRHKIDIDRRALRANIASIQACAQPHAVIAVIKANAYGLGIADCAPIYAQMGIHIFAVAAVSEAHAIRQALSTPQSQESPIIPPHRIILLGPPLPHEEQNLFSAHTEVCISSLEELHRFEKRAAEQTPPVILGIHIDIDTGMGRNGCAPDDAPSLIEFVTHSAHLRLCGICTHYPIASDDHFASTQEACFESIIESCAEHIPSDCLIHRANSEGLLLRPSGSCNAVRIGLLMTGVNTQPTTNSSNQQPQLSDTLRWSSLISHCKNLPANHGISYNRTHRLAHDSRIAIIPVGYADGMPMSLSNRGSVLIHGYPCPILGTVTMDYIMADISALTTQPQAGDEVIFIGSQGNAQHSIRTFAEQAGIIPYALLCGLHRHRALVTYHD